jgi:transposase-like protein
MFACSLLGFSIAPEATRRLDPLFDLIETNVRSCVKQAEIDQGERPGLTSEERAELIKLRRENRSLREDVEILKRATAQCRKSRHALPVGARAVRIGEHRDLDAPHSRIGA